MFNRNLANDQLNKVLLIVGGEVLHDGLETQQRVSDPLLVCHHVLAVVDLDLNFALLQLN
ncbi:MAG TPA: hypothetical protein VEH04_07325 [Verrucomicrobiae bacterium]|nr:hypothetical protein [Verrucomicrobiae bacterium]